MFGWGVWLKCQACVCKHYDLELQCIELDEQVVQARLELLQLLSTRLMMSQYYWIWNICWWKQDKKFPHFLLLCSQRMKNIWTLEVRHWDTFITPYPLHSIIYLSSYHLITWNLLLTMLLNHKYKWYTNLSIVCSELKLIDVNCCNVADERGCSYCGGLGHRITDCPKLEAIQNKQASNIGRRDYLASNAADY